MPITPFGPAAQINTTTGQNEVLVQVRDLPDGSHIAFYAQNSSLGSFANATTLIGRYLGADGLPVGNEIVLTLPSVPSGYVANSIDIIAQADSTFVALREVSRGALPLAENNRHALFQHYNLDGSHNGNVVVFGSTSTGSSTDINEFIASPYPIGDVSPFYIPTGGFTIQFSYADLSRNSEFIAAFGGQVGFMGSTSQPSGYSFAPFILQSSAMVRISEAPSSTLRILLPGSNTFISIPVNNSVGESVYREGPSSSIFIFGDYGNELAVYRINADRSWSKVAMIPIPNNVSRDYSPVDLLIRPDGGFVIAYSIFENGASDSAIRQYSVSGEEVGSELRLGFAGGIDRAPFLFDNADGTFSVVYNATTEAADADVEVFAQRFNFAATSGSLTGTTGDDSLSGTSGVNMIIGLSGNDTLDGRGGGDVIDGGPGNDLIYYYGTDTASNIRGGSGTDTLLVVGGSAPTQFLLGMQGFEGARLELSDNTSAITWRTISYLYNSGWQALSTNQINDDGSRIATQFDPHSSPVDRGAFNWSQIIEEYNAAGTRLIQRTYNDDNTYQFFYWDPAGAQTWDNFSETFNASGQRLLQRIYNDGGTYRFFYWDAVNAENWMNFDEEFDASGGRHTQRLVYDDGSTRNFYWDTSNSSAWTTFDEEYTAGPNATRSIQRIANDDGTSSQQFWDTTNTQSYSTYVDYTNAAGQRVEQRIFHDLGSNAGGYTRFFYDPANLQPWSTRTDVYNASGVLISTSQVAD